MKDKIEANLTWNEHDFIALYRAAKMARSRSYDSPTLRAVTVSAGLVMVPMGLLILSLVARGIHGRGEPISLGVVACFSSLYGVIVLYWQWYGCRRSMRRAFQRSGLADLKTSYIFTPEYIELTSRMLASKRSWELTDRAVEFLDGFLLVNRGGSVDWVPKYAFREPFDDVEFAEMVRSCVKKYSVVNRTAALPE